MLKILSLFLLLSLSAQAATEFEVKPLRWLPLPPADQTQEIVSTLQEVGQWASQSPQLILPSKLTSVLSSELSSPYFDYSTLFGG